MTKTNFDDVGDFMRRFKLPHLDERIEERAAGPNGGAGPQPWDDQLLEFRTKFLREELEEFEKGVAEHDHAQMADALIDLVYVAMGTAHLLGYPWQVLWDRVQHANMQKVRAATDGSDSRRGSSFDVVKPADWRPPDIEGVLTAYGFDLINDATCPKCGAVYQDINVHCWSSKITEPLSDEPVRYWCHNVRKWL